VLKRQKKNKEVQCQQIVMAINCLERELADEFSTPHAKQTKEQIKKLNAQLKELRKK
tara:strand:- start:347 stop:517 length:171 start_codon:yes stop_codon:yes gene_type:complete